MVMEQLRDVATLNLEGIQNLQGKKIVNALCAFEAAVSIAKQVAMAITDDRVLTNWTGCGQTSEHLQLGDRIGFQSDFGWVFDRPLIIPVDPKLDDREDLISFVHWSSTALMFNYALACHQLGTMYNSGTGAVKATRLYELVLNMVDTAERSSLAHYDVVRSTALNNLAHLYYCRCAFQQSKHAIEAMYETLLETSCLFNYLSEEEIELALLNTFVLDIPTGAHAA